VSRHVADSPERLPRSVQAWCLEAVQRLLLAKIVRQLSVVQNLTIHTVHAEHRRFQAFPLERHQRGPRCLSLWSGDPGRELLDRRFLDESRYGETLAELLFNPINQ